LAWLKVGPGWRIQKKSVFVRRFKRSRGRTAEAAKRY
jgi:hypothetical protein